MKVILLSSHVCAFFLQGARLNKSVWNKIPKHWIFVSALCRSGKLTLVCLAAVGRIEIIFIAEKWTCVIEASFKVVFLTGKKGKS